MLPRKTNSQLLVFVMYKVYSTQLQITVCSESRPGFGCISNMNTKGIKDSNPTKQKSNVVAKMIIFGIDMINALTYK